jgi:hypothetical protein
MTAWAFVAVISAASAVYLTGGGFMTSYVHQHPRHNRFKCSNGVNCPCFLWAGFGWPVLLVFVLATACWKAGEMLEDQRPVRRRERREVERKKDLRSIQ